MATRRKEEERRSQILWATIECVAEMGIEGSTMKSIAQRAGVSTGLLTYYFRDKNDLMKSALAFGHQMVGERTRSLRDASGDQEGLRPIFKAGLVEKPPRVPPLSFWIEYWAHSTRDPELMEFRAERIARFRQNWAARVRSGIEGGEFRSDIDPLLAADMLQALLDGLQLKVALDARTVSAQRAMRAFQLAIELMHAPGVPLAVEEADLVADRS
jgi:AcrR family transcriptional regulator